MTYLEYDKVGIYNGIDWSGWKKPSKFSAKEYSEADVVYGMKNNRLHIPKALTGPRCKHPEFCLVKNA